MWTIEKYKEVHARYEASGLSVEQFCMNELIARSRFYYWLRKYRKLPDKSVSIKSHTANADTGRKEQGFIPVWIGSTSAGKQQGAKVTGEEVALSSVHGQPAYMEISYQNGTTVRLGGARDMELVRTLILLSR